MERAAASHLRILRLTDEEMYVGSPEAKVSQHIFIDLFHLVGPVCLTIVRAALVQQDALDDTCLLGLPGHLDDAAVRVCAIVIPGYLSPPLIVIVFVFLLVQILVEHLDGTAAHSNGNDTDLLVGEFLYHRTTEIVGRSQFAHRADDRAFGLIPVAQCTLGIVKVARCQHLETLIDIPFVLGFPLGIAFHIRLPETDIDIEIGINFCVHIEIAGHQHETSHE